jgi:uncharacterized membrane protein
MNILKTTWKIFLTICTIYFCSGLLFVSLIAVGLIPILWIGITTLVIFMFLDLLLFALLLAVIWSKETKRVKRRKK